MAWTPEDVQQLFRRAARVRAQAREILLMLASRRDAEDPLHDSSGAAEHANRSSESANGRADDGGDATGARGAGP